MKPRNTKILFQKSFTVNKLIHFPKAVVSKFLKNKVKMNSIFDIRCRNCSARDNLRVLNKFD